MKRILFIMLIAAASLSLLSGGAQAQSRSAVAGTWIGEAKTESSSTKFVLEIADKDGVLSGTIRRDPEGEDDVFDLEDLEFKDGKLFFDYSESEGLADMTQVELKLEGEKLEGTWRNSEGESGAITFVRKRTQVAS
ncbi:MAG TPA: hypothetical protein VKT17_09375 [Acidobacteriota bacterium]|nr:hypothetical protein [Acidobacteriota bacterium]